MYDNEIYSSSETFDRSAVPNNGYTAYQTGAPTGTGAGNGGNHKKGGLFRKIMLSVSLGLCFGLFAGIGFYVVEVATTPAVQEEGGEVSETLSNEVIYPANDNVAQTVSNISYVTSDISDVVEEVMPAMVSIVNNYVETSTFWGQPRTDRGVSSGSGIIVAESDNELLIVSNNHVVEGAEKLTVTFIDESEAVAVIKGLDPDMDLAVIAVPLASLTDETRDAVAVATLGNSDELKLGQPVIAIGNALGYGQSVTNGIISALNREMTSSDGSTGVFIQTNAAINPGNSGGALLNINGEVIGINSNKIVDSRTEGMGYAIPITSASPIIAELMERQTRSVVVNEENQGYMGITPQNVTEEFSVLYGIPQGVYVYSVQPDMAADKAGIRKGDIIVRFDGTKIKSASELVDMLQYYSAGETVEVTVERVENGQYVSRNLEITLDRKSQ